MGEWGGGEEKGRPDVSFSSLPLSRPSFPFSHETPETQANHALSVSSRVIFLPLRAKETKEQKKKKKLTPESQVTQAGRSQPRSGLFFCFSASLAPENRLQR